MKNEEGIKPIILTTLSCIGVGLTAYFSRKNTIKTIKKNSGTTKEVVKDYIPTIVSGTLTIGLIIFNQKSRSNYISSLGALACAGGEAIRANYQKLESKARELYGDEKVDNVYKKVAEDDLNNDILTTFAPDIPYDGQFGLAFDSAEDGDVLFYDPFIGNEGLWFRTSKEAVRLAWYYCCRKFTIDGCFSYYDFYRNLGIELDSKYLFCGWSWGDTGGFDAILWPDLSFLEGNRPDTGEKFYILRYEYEAGGISNDCNEI